MKVEIKFLSDDAKPKDAAKDSATLVLQRKRDGDDYFVNVESRDIVEGGESQTITLKGGEQLVIVSKNTNEELVFDSKENAAVRASNQTQGRAGADRPEGAGHVKPGGPGAEGGQPGTNASPAASDKNAPANSSAEQASLDKQRSAAPQPLPRTGHDPSPGTKSSKDVK